MPLANKKISIAHLHVSDRKNKGDVAIVLAVQELLRKKFPGCLIKDYSVHLLKSGTKAEAKKVNRADLVVIGGGGILYSYFLPYSSNFIAAINKPIILFGIGYIREVDAPPLSQAAAKSAVFLVKRARAVGVRDYKTKAWLVKNGAIASKIKVVGDPAALLQEKKPPKFKFQGRSDIRIGLNLNYSGWLGFGKWHEDILRAYREVVQYFIENYGGAGEKGVSFYYLKHHLGENKIYPELKIKNLCVVDLKPAEQKYVYGQLDLVLGMMLHVGVMSFGAGTPEISVAYDLRNHSFADYISCPELVVDLKDLKKGELLRRVKRVFSRRLVYRNRFFKSRQKTLRSQQRFLESLKSVI